MRPTANVFLVFMLPSFARLIGEALSSLTENPGAPPKPWQIAARIVGKLRLSDRAAEAAR
jgi:hypothetical protein